jgi:fumarylpyruvate hydrolase
MDFAFEPRAAIQIPVVNRTHMFPVNRVYCVGRNYVEHAKEMGDTSRAPPFFFLKPTDTVVPPSTNLGGITHIQYPSLTHNYHYEVELVIAIGKSGFQISPAMAWEHIYGFAVGLDMTRRDLQASAKASGKPWCVAKSADQSAPIGAITHQSEWNADSLKQAHIQLNVNGELRQHSALSALIWRIDEVIAHLSQAWTLQAGDLIFTGTPAGVSATVVGDTLEANITNLTPLTVYIDKLNTNC